MEIFVLAKLTFMQDWTSWWIILTQLSKGWIKIRRDKI